MFVKWSTVGDREFAELEHREGVKWKFVNLVVHIKSGFDTYVNLNGVYVA